MTMLTDEQRQRRFWSRVQKSDGCWTWTGSKDGDGYGFVGRDRAHRFSYELANGPIPKGLCVLHTCDNPPCVRPDHLFLGTHADNVADRHAKGRDSHKPRVPVRIGEAQPMAKLTNAVVAEIRAAYATGTSTRDLAKRHGVSQPTISRVVRGRLWTAAPGPVFPEAPNGRARRPRSER